ncbi:hypothetical protein GRI89_06865 [Altererythrobacter salegens]|uniref:Uncharacterized protein n=1 Tax=Croceibacterium salegens TaxID=1737568 RepID=A0A6I4SV51_9SPHN|nr:hypothetical protein [Croceibacterium salegens]MXO59259.1 hypothetical protein [Croceibacterium salegens]
MVTFRDRLPALAALTVPVLAGMAWMAAFDAPDRYVLLNSVALAVAGSWMLFGRAPEKPWTRRALTLVLIAWLFVPLATGPHVNGIARWVSLGPVTLHAGMLAIPPLAVLAARDPDYAPPILLGALFAALLQPDAATGFAITFAAVGLHHVTKDWKVGAASVIGFFAAIYMALHGELPPQEFVERVLQDAAGERLELAIGLAAALAIGYCLILWTAPLARHERFALAGSLFGFIIMAMMSHYPFPLIGHGAAPILGYGIALGLVRKVA